MYPVLLSFHLGETEVVLRAYSTFYVLAWVVAVALATATAWRRGFNWWRALVVFAGALAVGIVGARLLDVGVSWNDYVDDTSRIYGLGFRGFALYGGLTLGLGMGVLLSRALRLPIWRLADTAVPALAAGIVLMRVGCFLNGCCFGTVTTLPWGITYPPGSPAWAQQLATGEIGLLGLTGAMRPVHPTQLYEMIGALAMGALAVWLTRRRGPKGGQFTPNGVPFLVFALGFTLFRTGNNLLRAPSPSMTAPGWFYPIFYLLICAVVATVLVWRVRHAARATHAARPGRTKL